jgi:acetyl-CoA C-acetyltransferase
MCDYLGLKPRYVDSTDTGGSVPLEPVAHAAQATADKCRIALITLAGMPRSQPAVHTQGVRGSVNLPDYEFEQGF